MSCCTGAWTTRSCRGARGAGDEVGDLGGAAVGVVEEQAACLAAAEGVGDLAQRGEDRLGEQQHGLGRVHGVGEHVDDVDRGRRSLIAG
jgi:hypothetical protein